MKKTCLLFLLLLLVSAASHAQQWGLYTLYATDNGTAAYLIDTNSTSYKSWTFSSSAKSTYSAYLTPEKVLVRTYSPTGAWGGGGCTGGVQKVDWSGTVIWDFQYFATNDYCLHHDICPLPNGNILMICYDYRSSTEAVQAGLSSSSAVWSERIIEVKPTGATTGTIVWEWYLWDHMCQSYNSAKDNYVTNTADHPELMNINYAGSGSLPDRYHMNGIDYNAALDQIIVSMHYMNSVFIIDHSTTTAQAAGHTGGNSGKGGDFLYRWGNPASYGATGTTMFNVIHDAHWVPSNNPNYPGYLCGYNNQGGTGGKTAITIWNPPYSGNSYTFTTGTVNPTTYAYQFTTAFTAGNKGNSQQLPNGNMLICNPMGAIYEINSSGTSLWTKASANSCHAYRYDKCYVRGPIGAITTDTSICQGESISLNGSATSVTETSPTYTWAWSGTDGYSSTSQNNSVSPTSTTTYTLTVTNTALSCWDTATVTVNVHPAPTIAVNATPASVCSGYSTSITASGGTTYVWNTGATTTSITASPSTTTTYTVTGTASGCSNTATVSVAVLTAPTVTASASSTSVCSGQSSTLTAGGASTYSWSHGLGSGTTATVSPSSTTTYSVTGTGTNGCTNTANVTVTVSASAALTVSASPTAICYGNSTTISATGATSYTWSNSATTPAITVSPTTSTTYSVTGTASGCTGTGSITITVNPLPTIGASASPASICSGQSSALTASGGSTYSWSHSAGSNSSVTVSPTSTTTYTVTGTNASACSNTSTVSITVNPSPSASLSASPASYCAGGSSTLTAGGGDTYTWSGGLGSGSSKTVSPSSTTTYTVTVANASGCTSTASTTVTVNPIPNISISPSLPALCTGQSTTLTGTGGSSYSWNQGLGTGNNFSVSPSSTTTYQVTGTDANGCSNTASVTITVNTCTQPTAAFSASDYDFCAGQAITINDISTGMNVDTWAWSFPGSNLTSATTQGPHSITYFSAGTYSITLTIADDNGMDDTTITVSVHAMPTLSLSASPSVVCSGSSSTLSASGAASYIWDQGLPAGNTQTVSPAAATTYQVTGTDAWGCQNSASVTVSVSAAPNITLTAGTTSVCAGNSTSLVASGGTSYTWNQGLSGASNTVSPSTTTVYNVTGTDVNNCQNTASVTISVLAAPVITISANPAVICSGGSTTLTASGASIYSWSDGSTSNPRLVSPPVTTMYNLTGITAQGCAGTSSVTITVSEADIDLTATPAAICSGSNTLLSASGGVTYTWDHGLASGSSNVVSPTSTTTYVITGTNSYNCSDTASATIVVNPLPSAPVISQNGNDLTSSAAGSYQWYLNGTLITGATTQTMTATQNGNYTVVISDINGCSATSEPFTFSYDGIESPVSENLQVMPNPTNGLLTLSGELIENSHFDVEINNTFGQQILQISDTKNLDLSAFPEGVYFVVVRTGTHYSVTKVILNK